YRAGALSFGSDHALLPLLHAEAVSRGWLSGGNLMAAYGVAEALPGPASGLAGFVGATQELATGGWRGGLIALAAVLLPGWLLVLGVTPLWDRLKGRADLRGAVAGVNA